MAEFGRILHLTAGVEASLSLDQLVTVGVSLVRASSAPIDSFSPCDRPCSTALLSLPSLVAAWGLTEPDSTAVLAALASNQAWKQLMAVIYLLRRCSNAVDGLERVVLPVLHNVLRTNDDALTNACLAAAFLQPPSKSMALESVLVQCRANWVVGCRVLARLYEWVEEPQRVAVVEALTEQALTGLEAAERVDDHANNPYLQRLHQDLLPVLIHRRTAVERLWTAVWQRYKQQRAQAATTLGPSVETVPASVMIGSLMATTTVLCTILPILNDTNEPLHLVILWQLIHQCISQGLVITKQLSWVAESWLDSSNKPPAVDPGTSQLLRRRGLYLLRVLVEEQSSQDTWNKYVACYETMEMESTPHLIDQVWETLGEVAGAMDDETPAWASTPPPMTWAWVRPMLARVITASESPPLRKLSLYRLFRGQGGVLMPQPEATAQDAPKRHPKKKKTRSRPAKVASGEQGMPLTTVTPDFVLETILPAFDTLDSAVGSRMHLEKPDGKEIKEDMHVLLCEFLDLYLATLVDDPVRCQVFFRGLWSTNVVCLLLRKTTVEVFECVANGIESKHPTLRIPVTEDMLQLVTDSFVKLFAMGSLVMQWRETLLRALSTMLAHTESPQRPSPKTILDVLALYHFPVTREGEMVPEDANWLDSDPKFVHLGRWLDALGADDPSWASTVGSALATGYVDGAMLSDSRKAWDPLVGISELEREHGKAVALFCALSRSATDKKTAGELLWPAINKGISNAPAAMFSSSWPKADRVTRALELIQNGCKLQVISGMGNGDLVLDRKTQQMMPPPTNIEALLANSVSFILHQIKTILSCNENLVDVEPRQLSSTFASLIGQLRTFHQGYPSSMAVSSAVDGILKDSVEAISKDKASGGTAAVQRIAIVYATLSCGAEMVESEVEKSCLALLEWRYVESTKSAVEEQSARSVSEYAKWGAISLMLPHLLDIDRSSDKTERLLKQLFDIGVDSIQAAPPHALVPLFQCMVTATKNHWLSLDGNASLNSSRELVDFERVLQALIGLMGDCKSGSEVSYMLDEICALIFQPSLLAGEASRLSNDSSCATPVRDTFRRFIKSAGRQRTQIAEAVLCRITCAWLVPLGEASPVGSTAIPYRADIVELLVHKEEKIGAGASSQFRGLHRDGATTMVLPKGTDGASVSRAFVLMFLSRLPNVSSGLSPIVMSELVHFIILRLLEVIKPVGGGLLVRGSQEFCLKSRGWQALCVLSRFVTSDIADQVADYVHEAMAEQMHGQIRYFIEVFTLQCARQHPTVFGRKMVDQIRRTDLSFQHVTSLMIVAGNLLVGRYKDDFFKQYERKSALAVPIGDILAGATPWLGSTQSFTRAIAQLLVHKLIPLVLDVSKEPSGPGDHDSNWYLRAVFHFLEENGEMIRLRKKQSKFFETYDVDPVCTPEGLLSIPIDEGDEAFPIHLMDVIKECLQDVFNESQEATTPTWKCLELLMQSQPVQQSPPSLDSSGVNFQRKIVPVDALNLALEDIEERRLRNSAGRKKQQLIVCASLIDKVPNLGGLARTSEIFAADRLVIPDLGATKTDMFKSLSASATDWIEIEACEEAGLLAWLRERKKEGYYVVGLEQTPSSVCLSNFTFPDRPTVLLLGKEKEGIPVEYLQAVDQCVEIPQLGIIRSLNVHVSGAIAIWEQTRQKIVNGKLK